MFSKTSNFNLIFEFFGDKGNDKFQNNKFGLIPYRYYTFYKVKLEIANEIKESHLITSQLFNISITIKL